MVSELQGIEVTEEVRDCLNPCSNGSKEDVKNGKRIVLILVLMADGL